jgi:signal peptidase I
MLLIRFFLISLIVYLIVRSFLRSLVVNEPENRRPEPEKRDNITIKKVSKEVGEYVDYEEVE